jgi:hypothetical protein
LSFEQLLPIVVLLFWCLFGTKSQSIHRFLSIACCNQQSID